MQLMQGEQFARMVLQKKRRLRWDFGMLLLLLGLLRLIEWTAAVVLLRLTQAEPISLLTYDALAWRSIQLALTISGGFFWVWCSWTVWLRCTRAAGMADAHRHYAKGKMFGLALQNTLIRTAFFQAIPLCLFGAYRLAEIGAQHTEGAPWLFGAVQLVVAGVLFFLLWGYVTLGLCCVPFVWFASPDLPFWSVPLRAMRVMRGGRKELLFLLFWYTVQLLPLVTIPFVLPRAGVALSVFFNIRVKQYALT